ncbi:hypothetical protein [Streptomyces sp. H39-S7]|uniref:hypothetical protein n=1 Tax=Streptomyces sp. H39-S7 TaxID=3004357 RepID=UPI0022B03B8E|nr:hypothetical protein [Streptomyces sp. H39-S7]MCZ4117802.1 hypothetical protein [Streptomyces sp. H39-S7]
MAPRTRTPNTALRTLLTEAQWTRGQLVRAVVRVGAEQGVTLTYDDSTVSYWLKGSLPGPEIRPFICEAFSRRLRRPVTSAEAGFGSDTESGGADLVSDLVDLGRADMDPSRRGVLAAGLYSAALMVPRYTDLSGRLEASTAGRTIRVGPGEVATVRTMTDRIADILDELGGGHARPMAAAFLLNTVSPYLRADGSESVKRDMLAAASDLVYLTGWMAMYEREHGLGQRYYVQALHLAGSAEDHLTYCRTLRGMALQASNLGHGPKALELADSAAEASPKAGPRLRAFLAGQQAHGAGMVKDRRQAFARLAETETALSKADGRNDAVGGYDQSAYQFHVSHVLYELGDLPGSVKALQQSNRVRPPQERQGRVHANGLLAQRQLELGHVEAACATWETFLDDYAVISSARGDDHFHTMRLRIRPHLTNGAARNLHQRAVEVAALKA